MTITKNSLTMEKLWVTCPVSSILKHYACDGNEQQ